MFCVAMGAEAFGEPWVAHRGQLARVLAALGPGAAGLEASLQGWESIEGDLATAALHPAPGPFAGLEAALAALPEGVQFLWGSMILAPSGTGGGFSGLHAQDPMYRSFEPGKVELRCFDATFVEVYAADREMLQPVAEAFGTRVLAEPELPLSAT